MIVSFGRRIVAVPVAVFALLVGACSGGQPLSTEPAPADAVSAASVEVPTVEPGTPELPVTFRSDDSVEVEVTSLDRVLVLDDA
ncbi:MAG TPA: hypothetical protein VK103_00185, partial [Bacillota bacterium]|nr:hypothetical protein [Bacillota bacterium]